jgi:predicted enzyme related to lactoylglutathione lyase
MPIGPRASIGQVSVRCGRSVIALVSLSNGTSAALGSRSWCACCNDRWSSSSPASTNRNNENMTARIGDIVIDCNDPRRVAEFWCAALGYRMTEFDDTGVAVAGHSSAPTLLFLTSADHKVHKNRIHFDICPVEGSTRDEEVARLETLGAVRVDIGQVGGSWVVMADPGGNEFCVMNTVLPPEPAPFHHR